MNKKFLFFLTIILFTASLLLHGCGAKTQQSGNADKTEAKQEVKQEAKQEVIELKFSYHSPKAVLTGKFYDKVPQIVAEKTNGRIKITNYFNGSLLGFPEAYKGVSSGIADIAGYLVDQTPGVQSLNRIFDLPFTTVAPDFAETSKIYEELLVKFPELQQEMEKTGTRWLTVNAAGGNHLHTTGKQIESLEDLKGMRFTVHANTADQVEIMKKVGVALVPSNPATTYENLDKGLTEGMLAHFPVLDALKATELLKNHVLIGENGLAQTSLGVIINLKTWNRLSPEDQKIIQEAYQSVHEELTKTVVQHLQNIIKNAKEQGHTFSELPPQEVQKLYDLAKIQKEKWIAENEAKGLPAKKIAEELDRLLVQAVQKQK